MPFGITGNESADLEHSVMATAAHIDPNIITDSQRLAKANEVEPTSVQQAMFSSSS